MVGRQRFETQFPDVAGLVDELLARGLHSGATDVHFEPTDKGLWVRGRIDGQLSELELLPLPLAENVVARLKVLASLLTYRIDIPQEGAFAWKPMRVQECGQAVEFRLATFPTIRGERAVARVFRAMPALQALDALGLSVEQLERLRRAIAQPGGLIVTSGPAGSGKTTTLYALIREMRDRFHERSVITLEDPVEQRIDRVAQIQINPHGELNYERCMRSLLRHDPQVIMLGEVRDRRTAGIALEAALTGHLILTSVHSGDPAETIVRFLEMDIPPYQLASALTLVCTQRLVRKVCASCRGARGGNCAACCGRGYAGRTAVAQLVEVDEPTRELILRNASASALRVVLKAQKPDLRERAAALVADGITDADEVARVLGCYTIPMSRVPGSRPG